MFIMILVRLALVRLVFIKRIERRNLGDDTAATFNGRRAVGFYWMGTSNINQGVVVRGAALQSSGQIVSFGQPKCPNI